MKISCSIGCAGLLTDLPLIVAQAKGFFPTDEIQLELSVELGWASIELKLTSGQLTAANVPPSFPILLSLKKSGMTQPMHALAITSYHGEAITLNREAAAAVQAGKLGTLKSLRIGVDAPHTLSHAFVQTWLRSLRQERNSAIQLVPLAISQLRDLMKDGYIQGFCCAEPIGQIAHDAGIGVTVARSRDYPPLHIQSVVATTDAFFTNHPGAAKAIAAGVERGRQFCAVAKNEAEILRLYRKQLLPRLAASGPALTGTTHLSGLSSLIGFDAPTTKDKDLLQSLATACATLPGVTVAEREIRETVKRVFSTLP